MLYVFKYRHNHSVNITVVLNLNMEYLMNKIQRMKAVYENDKMTVVAANVRQHQVNKNLGKEVRTLLQVIGGLTLVMLFSLYYHVTLSNSVDGEREWMLFTLYVIVYGFIIAFINSKDKLIPKLLGVTKIHAMEYYLLALSGINYACSITLGFWWGLSLTTLLAYVLLPLMYSILAKGVRLQTNIS